MKVSRLLLLLCVAQLYVGVSEVAFAAKESTEPSAADRLEDCKLLMCFEGKSSSVIFDFGVAAEAYRRIPALKEGNVILSASSSGALPAIFFSCNGFNDESLEKSAQCIKDCTSTLSYIRKHESNFDKAISLLMGEPTEMSHDILKKVIGLLFDVDDWETAKDVFEIADRSKYEFRLPVMIVAANHEVIDNQIPKSLFAGKEEKEFDVTNYSVLWKPEVYDFYKKRPQKFASANPDLRLGETPLIGKACTYFVNEPMFELLKRLPPEERLADLRLMKTPRDMVMAIMASSCEPTFFPPIEERDYDLLMVGDRLGNRGNSVRRIYSGGFVMPLVAQDVRRLLPHLRVLGTGSFPHPQMIAKYLRARYIVDTSQTCRFSAWWADLNTAPKGPEWKSYMFGKLTPDKALAIGSKRAAVSLQTDKVFPPIVARPAYNSAAEHALGGPRAAAADSPLPTRRGLGDLARPIQQ
ncbi:MAG: hypothetical protein JXM70_04620 [Pirellulales bacterium]|nr:hypothetical protein [Pirellulales bacterium]